MTHHEERILKLQIVQKVKALAIIDIVDSNDFSSTDYDKKLIKLVESDKSVVYDGSDIFSEIKSICEEKFTTKGVGKSPNDDSEHKIFADANPEFNPLFVISKNIIIFNYVLQS